MRRQASLSERWVGMVSLAAEASAIHAPGEAAPAARAGGDLLNIQYLRAAAAIGVLIFHAADRTGAASASVEPGWTCSS
jgi:hypothetical protein